MPSLIEGLRVVQGLRVVPVSLYRYSMQIGMKKARSPGTMEGGRSDWALVDDNAGAAPMYTGNLVFWYFCEFSAVHLVYRYVIQLKARFKRFAQNSPNRLAVAKNPLESFE